MAIDGGRVRVKGSDIIGRAVPAELTGVRDQGPGARCFPDPYSLTPNPCFLAATGRIYF